MAVSLFLYISYVRNHSVIYTWDKEK